MRITDDVADAVRGAGIAAGMAPVCAMHITAGVWINDDEPAYCEFDGGRPKRLVIKVLVE